MAEITIAAATKVGEAVISKVANETVDSVWRQIRYVWDYKSNLQGLKEQLNKLKNERKSLEHSVDEAKRNGQLIEDTVTNWFQMEDDAINVAEKIIEDHQNANKSCFIGCCPNLKTRHQFSRKAKKHIPVLAEVQGGRSSINKIYYVQYVQELSLPKDYEALESRTDVLNQIVAALKNVDFNLIGLCGLPGVGKTTLAIQQLVHEVKRDEVFKVVIWSKVTRTYDLKAIQEQLAELLGLHFDVNSTQARALRLCERLRKEEKVLVILDDIWISIKLDEIGIPNDKDSKGCKVFMTSRHQNVLSAMGVQKHFVLMDLQEKEAWQLFQKKIGTTIDPNFQSTAFEVSKRCVGLPGLITAVATTLRNQPLVKWKDSLLRLKKFDLKEIDDKVNSALELSYDFLEDDARSLFLLCGQNGPHNIEINYMLKYSLGLGIFKSYNTIASARDRLLSLVSDLKASCWLLEAVNNDGVLHMHDLVHNFAITVASKDQLVITSNRMINWPEDGTLENCTAMVLTDRKIPHLPGVFNCPKLRFFLLNNGDLSLEVGDSFFGGMKGLRALNLKNASFSSLPLSLQFLKDLQTLCLDSCVLEDVTLIGELKKLEVFSLVNCTISRLPREVGDLTHLKLLDLKDCSSLTVIEPNVLSRLTQLEELYMENSFAKWEDNDANNGKRVNANLSELKCLSKLVTVHMHIVDAKMLPKNLQLVQELEDFKILIGEEWDWNVEQKTSRTLKLKLNTRDHLERVKGFLMRTEDLYLDDLQGVENVLDRLNGEGFPQLKHLLLQNSQNIRYIIDWRWMVHVIAFPYLESLSMNNLNKLERISSAPLKMRSFGSLKRLKVGSCSLLRNLFSFSMCRSLQQLEEIDVSSCEVMKMVVDDDNDGQDGAIKLDKLQTLTLDHLPQFASFCSQGRLPTIATRGCGEIIFEDETETPLVVFSEKIGFPNLMNLILTSINVENIWPKQLRDVSPFTKNLRRLIVDGCSKLGYIFMSSMVENLAQLEKLEVNNCSSMREVIVTEELEEEMMMTRKILFPKLDHLKLKHLPKLERFCSGALIECPSLNVLRVESCPHLQSFVSSSTRTDASVMPLFDEKVSFPKLEYLLIFHMHKLEMIWKNEFLAAGSFEKLKYLRVEHAKELIQLFPSNMFLRGLRNLETLVVKNCDLMEQVFDMEGVLQMKERHVLALRYMEMENLPMLKRVWIGDIYGMETVSWSNLRIVVVSCCRILKSLFPASIAIDLLQLVELRVSYCPMLEEVVDEGLETSPTFSFPKVNYLALWELHELRNFYPGAHTLECPLLETMWILACPKLEVFGLESPNLQETHMKSKSHVQPLFSFAQLVPNLKNMSLSYKDAIMIKESDIPTHLFQRLKLLSLEGFYDETSYLPFDLLQRFQNIQTLEVAASGFEELFPRGFADDDQSVGILSQIQLLKLKALDKLRCIWNEGSQNKQVLQNLHTLEVYGCHGLISLLPSFAAFRNLQTLTVYNCYGLMNLLEPTTVQSLVQLKAISVRNCNMITEIVATHEDEIQTEITLINLESVTLHCLKNFICFSLANCPMKFPSLTEVIVIQCPKMKAFSHGNLYSPKLKKVYVTEESDKWRWVGDFNSTIKQLNLEMAGFDGMQHLKLSEFPELKEKWLGRLPVELFSKLITLVVDDCAFQSFAIPSKLPSILIALEKLEIRNCAVLEGLYDLEWPNADGSFGYLSNLKDFQLINLPKLRHVWDEIPQDMLDFKNLTWLIFHNCNSLRNILTATVCLGLVQLKNLLVTNCEMVEEIITPPKSIDTTNAPSIVFPLLELIILKDLPKLAQFSTCDMLECAALTQLQIESCPRLVAFVSASSSSNVIPNSEAQITTPALFDEKVAFPNLERMELINMENLRMIWSNNLHFDSFGKLEGLKVEFSKQLLEMFPHNVLARLQNLQKLVINKCDLLEEVFDIHGLTNGVVSFDKLSSVYVWQCPNLKSLFPFSIAKSLQQLELLDLKDCGFVELVAKETGIAEEAPKFVFPRLKYLSLWYLEQLQCFFREIHTLDCPVLERLSVYHCEELKVFTETVAKPLENQMDKSLFTFSKIIPKLELVSLTSKDAVMIRERQFPPQLFDKTKVVELHCFHSESNIYPSDLLKLFHNMELLYVRHSMFKELFPSEGLDKALQSLKLLEVQNCHNLMSLAPYAVSFQNLTNLDVDNCKGLVSLMGYSTARSLVQLQNLSIRECDSVSEIVLDEGSEDEMQTEITLIKLESLKLYCLNNLVCFSFANCPIQFPSLTEVIVKQCPKMKFFSKGNLYVPKLQKVYVTEESNKWRWVGDFNSTIKQLNVEMAGFDGMQHLKLSEFPELKGKWLGRLPVELFSKLITLVVDDCAFQSFAIPSKLPPILIALEKLEIRNCAVLEGLYDLEWPNADGSFGYLSNLKDFELINLPKLRHVWDEIPQDMLDFKNLTWLIFHNCNSLRNILTATVCLGLVQLKNLQVTNCEMVEEIITPPKSIDTPNAPSIIFPLLELIILKDLPKLAQFSTCDMLECAALTQLQIESCPRLVAFVSDSSSSNVIPNSEAQITTPALFDEKVAFPNLERMELINMENLRMIWSNNLHFDSFGKLEGLKVESCKQLLEMFPHNILERLENLKDLVIKNCDLLEEVFDIHGLINAKEIESVTSQLKRLDIRNMLNLRCVWNEDPKGVVSFDELSSVYVWDCPNLKSLIPFSIAKSLQQLEKLDLKDCGVVELVAKETGIAEEAPKFVFPGLKYLDLWNLEQLECFFREIHTLDCPVLERLCVYNCGKLEVFSETIEKTIENQMDKSLFSFSKIISNLIQLSLTSKDGMFIKESQFPPSLFHKLKAVQLLYFDSEWEASPSDLLKLFHNMEILYVSCSMFKELFPPEGLDIALQSLKQLRVWNCHNLIYLTPFTASFKNLTNLAVDECKGLVSLMGHTTARSLVQLQKLSITNCDSVSEIVLDEGSEAEIQTEITLIKLESLKLYCLKSLVCFSLANCPTKFPSLTEVIVTQCPKMKFFSQGNLHAPKLKKVYVTEESNKWLWVGDLNSTIKQLDVEMAGFDGMQHLELSEFPKLKDKWLGRLPVELFSKLITLVVDDCPFQSVAIPSKLPSFLIALEKLEIRNCALLEELYDSEWSNADTSFGYLSNLKEFQLIHLPKLRHVWDEIPKNMLDVKNLTLLKFHNCSSLRNILTTTMCLGLVQLKNLQVTNCEMVEEIITQPKSIDRTIAPSIIFPLLECIIFEELPNLTAFCCGAGYVECPCLKKIKIAGCPLLNITNTVSESKVVSFHHLEDMRPTSIDIHNMWNCQGLTSLTIDGFENLKFLFSSSVAKSLKHLKELMISNCGMLKQVIAMELQEEQVMRLLRIEILKLKDLPKLEQFCTCDMLECASLKELQIENCLQLVAFVSRSSSSNVVPNSEPQITTPALFDEKVVFPNLQRMEVINMENLRMIWSNNLHSDSFGKLEVLKVESGKQLIEIFPHNILPRLENLKDLVIKNCDLLEEVFDTHGLINAKEIESVTSQLKTLDIRNMQNLRCVWNEDPKGVVSFDELSSVYVWLCPNLKSLFPFSIAKSLQQLEDLDLNRCGVVELVAKETGIVEEAPKFVFPHLKYLDLRNLEQLECFFRESHTLDCPVLKRLSVYRCDKLEVFTETIEKTIENQMDKSLFSFSKIIPNLEDVSLTSKDAVMMRESQFPPQLFHKVRIVQLHSFEWEAPPSDLLNLFHNIQELYGRSCMFKELFLPEGLDQVLQNLRVLGIYTCSNLITLVPLTAPFKNLTGLGVEYCDGLVRLMGLSTARSLVQLQKMSIKNCGKLSEIVSNEGSDDESKQEIVFTRLESLELNDLPSLVSFCSEDCSFKFPSLTQVIVSKCLNIKFFSKEVSATPKLKRVQQSEADKGHWNGNLNATVQELFTDQ